MNNIKNLFSVLILYKNLNLNLKNIKNFCDSFKKKDKGIQRSNVGGFQSKDLYFKKENIKVLEDEIILNIKELLNNYKFKKQIQPFISNIWINYNNKFDYNTRHIHSDSIFSGVYYVQCDLDKPANISFFHPGHDLINCLWKSNYVENFIECNSPLWSYIPVPNLLILFPSWIYHQVEPNRSKKTRISISFDINLK